MSLFTQTNIGRLILESITDEAAEKKASSHLDVSEIRKVSNDLEKVASLPYKEEVYQSVQELVKTAADYLNSSADELESSLGREAELKKAMEVRSIIDDMIHYGILDPTDVHDKVAELVKKTGNEIEIVKTAVDMVKNGKSMSSIFELDKTAAPNGKRGMFDGVL